MEGRFGTVEVKNLFLGCVQQVRRLGEGKGEGVQQVRRLDTILITLGVVQETGQKTPWTSLGDR